MKIKIIDETSDGDFTVGGVYDVDFVPNKVFVWAYDNKGNSEPVYYYEFEWVED